MTIKQQDVTEELETDVETPSAETDPAEAEANELPRQVAAEAKTDVESKPAPKSVSVSLRVLVAGVAIAVLAVAVAALSWLYLDARSQIKAQATRSDNAAHAEKIALDYAVNAATMDFKDLRGWHVRLVAGTSPELTKKLSDAGTSMEQVLVPLQWSSTAQPLVAKVRSVNGGIYVVDSFVSVQTKTVQAPEALQSTATYSTTIDSNNNWQITDVGGIGSAMGPK